MKLCLAFGLRAGSHEGTSHRLLALAVPFALVAVVGCSKPSPEEQKKQEDALAAALASAMAAPTGSATVTSGTAAAPANPGGGIVATCDNKQDGKCTETSGAEGMGADDSCKRLGGTYTKGATPCSHDNLLGQCARSDASSGLNDVDYYYKQQGADADTLKSLCEGVMSGKWTAAPKSAAPATAAPAKGKK